MKNIIYILLIFSLIGCKAKTIYVPVERKIVETVTVNDTIVDIQIEYLKDSTVTPDSSSFLSNRYGYSSAELKGGLLHHSLGTWPDLTLPFKIQYLTKYIYDSIPVPYKVEVPYPVEKKLTKWQKLRMILGDITLSALAVFLSIKFLRRKK